MEDDDNEKHFEILVHGQGEPDQDAKGRARLVYAETTWEQYMPMQGDTKLEDGDANQLGHSVFVRDKRS